MTTSNTIEGRRRLARCALHAMSIASCVVASQALAQAYVPPSIPNKDVDAYGVELKSSRYVRETPPIVAIGDGEHRMALSFSAADFNEFQSNYSGSVTVLPPSEAAIAVIFGRTSERFTVPSSQDDPNASYVLYRPQIPSGSLLTRQFDGSAYTYTFIMKDGVKIVFQPSSNRFYTYQVGRIVYPDGYEIDQDAYSIKDNKGYIIVHYQDPSTYENSFQAINNAYDVCNPVGSSLCASSSKADRIGKSAPGPDVSYSIALTDPTGNRSIYKYKPMQLATSQPNITQSIAPLVAIDLPGGGADEITVAYNYVNPNNITSDDLVITNVTTGNVSVDYQYTKESISTGFAPASPGYRRTTTARVGGVTQYQAFSIKPPVSQVSSPRVPTTMLTFTDGLGNVTSFQSDGFGQIAGATAPSGAYTSQSFDDRNNYTASKLGGSGVNPLITTRTFPPSCSVDTQAVCNKPTQIVDPNGGATDFTYNNYGQLLTVTAPAPLAGASRPVTTYSYSLRTAYVKGSNGSVVPAGNPISLLTRMSVCRTTAPCAGTPDEVVTDYDYGPTSGLNNLQLIGMAVTASNFAGQSEVHRTCYSYNYFGERVSTTNARSALGSCPFQEPK